MATSSFEKGQPDVRETERRRGRGIVLARQIVTTGAVKGGLRTPHLWREDVEVYGSMSYPKIRAFRSRRSPRQTGAGRAVLARR